MSERPEDRSEERRRRGPLGDDEEQTQQVEAEDSSEETRLISSDESSQRTSEQGEERRRVIRTPGSQEGSPYAQAYLEAAEEREDRLRDQYGGIDWLASFIGFVFAAVIGAVFFSLAGLVLVSLGFFLEIGRGDLGVRAVTGLVFIAILLFVAYFCGGYVAGRLARFDGGRNGAMTVLWGIILFVILSIIGLFLPGRSLGVLEIATSNGALLLQALQDLGLIGIGIAVGGLLLEALGGLAGGRLGSRYHTMIDRTT